jgi:hypothetical protein
LRKEIFHTRLNFANGWFFCIFLQCEATLKGERKLMNKNGVTVEHSSPV